MTDIFTATVTTPIYKEPNSAKAELIRLRAGDTATVIRYLDNVWLYGTGKGQTGYILRAKGTISQIDIPPAPAYRFGIIKLDYDTTWPDFGNVTHVSRPKRNEPTISVARGLPATGRFTGGMRIPFTHDLQLWIHGLCDGGVNTYQSDFSSLWRSAAFMTNDAGIEGRADYINMTNLDGELPMIEPMGCGGTVLKITSETATHYEFDAVNAYGDFRQYTPASHPWLFFPPTNSRHDFIDGIWYEDISNPFGQYDGKARIPVFANGDSDKNKIEKYRVRILAVDEITPNPFLLRPVNPYPLRMFT